MSKSISRVFAIVVSLIMLFGIAPMAFAAPLFEDDTDVAYNLTLDMYYDTLEDAIADAAEGETVVLVKNYDLPKSLSVTNGITLLIPSSSDYLKDDNIWGGNNVSGDGTSGDANVILTIPQGMKLTVASGSKLLVAGNQQGGYPRIGFRTGDYGAVDVEGTLEVNGELYARGRVYGDGKVIANSGSSVYQRFEIPDWRGGTQSDIAYNTYNIFPFALYQLGGIDADTYYMSGSSLYGQSYLVIYSVIGLNILVPYISSTSGSGHLISSDTNGEILFSKTGDITTITIDGGTVRTGDLKFSAEGYSFDSADQICPFGYNTNVVLTNNATLNVNTSLKVLPGCTFTVNEGCHLNIATGEAMYFYTAAKYLGIYNNIGWTNSNDAILQNYGTVTVNGTGRLGSNDADFTNIRGTGYMPNLTVTFDEYQQAVGPQPVEFHVYTPTPAA